MADNQPDPHDREGSTDLREAAADELREAAEHVEAGEDEEADQCATRGKQLLREAQQVELGEEGR